VPSIGQQLKRISRNKATRERYHAQMQREIRRARKKIEKDYEAIFADLAADDNAANAMLIKLAPFREGDRVQRIAADGRPGGPIMQITGVVSHEKFWVRNVQPGGGLAMRVEMLNISTRTSGRFSEPIKLVRVEMQKKAASK
jgi:hypothetical protein